jgi:hypothetical protein
VILWLSVEISGSAKHLHSHHMKFTSILLVLVTATVTSNGALTIGDVIFNEYAADNIGTDPNARDFFELLVVANGSDLRGLRISDNELATGSGTLNNGEAVWVFGNDAFLSNIPAGTLITVWIAGTGTGAATGISTDTVSSFTASDWSMTLTTRTGVTLGSDGLGGTLNGGLAAGGDALYMYLPGTDGTSAGTDNIYLDYISWESDSAVAPTGLTDINLLSLADNAYYTGNTATGNDLSSGWTRYDGPGLGTPGAANVGQNLSALQAIPEPTAALLGGLGMLTLLRRRR